MKREAENMTVGELRAELERLRENLRDIEDMHSFTYERTSVHIGGRKAHEMQLEFEEECRTYRERIAMIEEELERKKAV
jgi:hypothetical protein